MKIFSLTLLFSKLHRNCSPKYQFKALAKKLSNFPLLFPASKETAFPCCCWSNYTFIYIFMQEQVSFIASPGHHCVSKLSLWQFGSLRARTSFTHCMWENLNQFVNIEYCEYCKGTRKIRSWDKSSFPTFTYNQISSCKGKVQVVFLLFFLVGQSGSWFMSYWAMRIISVWNLACINCPKLECIDRKSTTIFPLASLSSGPVESGQSTNNFVINLHPLLPGFSWLCYSLSHCCHNSVLLLVSPSWCIQHFLLLSSKQNISHLFVFSDSPEDQSHVATTRREEEIPSLFIASNSVNSGVLEKHKKCWWVTKAE